MPGLVAVLVFFAVAVGVNDQQGENDCAADQEHEDERLVLPYFRREGKKVFEKV
jgi:hypothetical protein